MSQEAFGNKIGLKKSAISLLESGRNSLSEQTILSICREFGVSEDWLRTGEGDIFLPEKSSVADEVAERLDLNGLERAILGAYLDLPKEIRDNFCAGVYDKLFKIKKEPTSGESEAGKQGETSWEREARLLEEEAAAIRKGGRKCSDLPPAKDA